MLKERLLKLQLPSFTTRDRAIELLCEEEYGYLPPKPDKISFAEHSGNINNFCAGKATLKEVVVTVELYGKSFSFPFWAMVPIKEGKIPFFVQLGLDKNVPNRYLPAEEILDHGFAVLYLYYQEVTRDNDDFTDGLAGILYKNGERLVNDAGKISIWAWAAQRVMDYAQSLDCLDLNKSIICGHSRLGKTALLTAAIDTRFAFAYSNDSGCSGAALSRNKQGETVEKIINKFPHWFCKNYQKYRNNEENLPFDQHYLISAIAPRFAYVASANDDTWADPNSEFLSCVAAGETYKSQGLKGFICEDRMPISPERFHEGDIGYHIRNGAHYFSREDWLTFIDFFNKKTQ